MRSAFLIAAVITLVCSGPSWADPVAPSSAPQVASSSSTKGDAFAAPTQLPIPAVTAPVPSPAPSVATSPAPSLKMPVGSTCIDKQKQGCLAAISVGPAIGLSLFSIGNAPAGKAIITGPNFGGGGGQVCLDFWRASDGNYRAHVCQTDTFGAGVINGERTAAVDVAMTLGFGGFDHIPLVVFGPSLLQPLNGQKGQFAMVANGAAMALIQEF